MMEGWEGDTHSKPGEKMCEGPIPLHMSDALAPVFIDGHESTLFWSHRCTWSP